jgi:hypothetical protein
MATDPKWAALREAVSDAVPNSWLDDALTGPRGIKVPAVCPDIERLLNVVRARVLAVVDAHEHVARLSRQRPKTGAKQR